METKTFIVKLTGHHQLMAVLTLGYFLQTEAQLPGHSVDGLKVLIVQVLNGTETPEFLATASATLPKLSTTLTVLTLPQSSAVNGQTLFYLSQELLQSDSRASRAVTSTAASSTRFVS
jgi:hypothetical protein